MQLLSTSPRLLTNTPPAAPNQPAPPSNPAPQLPNEDALAADSFTFDFPSNLPVQSTELQELPSEPAPKLEKPVLLVHGYNSGPSTWENMKTWLVTQNPDGGVVKANTGNIDPNGKVFAMEFSRPYNPLSNNASELRQAIDRITAATGAKEIDVVAHSMGGLDTRLYLDQGNEKVDKLVMIGTPNHGSVLADIEMTFRNLGLPLLPPTDDALVRQALTDLSEVRGDNNPTLAQLNKNWDRQRSRANMLIITGNGKPTLASRFTLTMRGDAVVSQASARMPNVPVKNMWGVHHLSVKDAPQTLQMTGAFLSGRPLPEDDGEPPNVPPDREITPQQIHADKEQIQYVVNP